MLLVIWCTKHHHLWQWSTICGCSLPNFAAGIWSYPYYKLPLASRVTWLHWESHSHSQVYVAEITTWLWPGPACLLHHPTRTPRALPSGNALWQEGPKQPANPGTPPAHSRSAREQEALTPPPPGRELPDLHIVQPVYYQDTARRMWFPGEIMGVGPEPSSYHVCCSQTKGSQEGIELCCGQGPPQHLHKTWRCHHSCPLVWRTNLGTTAARQLVYHLPYSRPPRSLWPRQPLYPKQLLWAVCLLQNVQVERPHHLRKSGIQTVPVIPHDAWWRRCSFHSGHCQNPRAE